ncbi:AMP-dependent synthetase and ligase [Candidatus Burkholderia humilis]|nr:AMP-dependent synthetase and ligase [Candidatus Burkholderia humilis]
MVLSNGVSVRVEYVDPLSNIGNGTFLQVPISLWIFIAAVLLLGWILKRTPFGLRLYLMGTNPKAAFYAGIPRARMLIVTYGLCGVFASLAGLISATHTSSAKWDYGNSYLLIAILIAVLVDREFSAVMRAALKDVPQPILVIDVDDPQYTGAGERIGEIEYEALLAGGDVDYAWSSPSDEWNAICLNYTSGTTGNPKGVVYHHRGAYTNAISNILEWDMPKHAVYLWTLPMFHYNGWCFSWTVAVRAGVNVCLRRVDAKLIFDLIRSEGVTHYCGAPIVQNLLVNAPDDMKTGITQKVHAMVAGAAPPAAMIEDMERLGFELTHVYGLTEVYGLATVCAQQSEWSALDIGERARLNARQGVRYHLQDAVSGRDPSNMEAVPRDGETIGEIMFRGNIAMKGYLKNAKATEDAFRGGWFHTGDLAVAYPDGYVRIKERSKDIIISGGENISSIEVEDVLYRHPAVLAVAVVAKPDARWGETPCAFIELKAGAQVSAEELIAHCKTQLVGFKMPRAIEFCELPKTSTGKIQKFELHKRAGSVTAINN